MDFENVSSSEVEKLTSLIMQYGHIIRISISKLMSL